MVAGLKAGLGSLILISHDQFQWPQCLSVPHPSSQPRLQGKSGVAASRRQAGHGVTESCRGSVMVELLSVGTIGGLSSRD